MPALRRTKNAAEERRYYQRSFPLLVARPVRAHLATIATRRDGAKKMFVRAVFPVGWNLLLRAEPSKNPRLPAFHRYAIHQSHHAAPCENEKARLAPGFQKSESDLLYNFRFDLASFRYFD